MSVYVYVYPLMGGVFIMFCGNIFTFAPQSNNWMFLHNTIPSHILIVYTLAHTHCIHTHWSTVWIIGGAKNRNREVYKCMCLDMEYGFCFSFCREWICLFACLLATRTMNGYGVYVEHGEYVLYFYKAMLLFIHTN